MASYEPKQQNRPGKREAEGRRKEKVEKKERRTRKRGGVMRRRSDASLPQQHPKATTTLR